MTDPIKALADAARRCSIVLHNMAKERDGWHLFGRWEISDEPLRNDAMHLAPLLDDALAAYDAAQVPPSDAEICKWRDYAIRVAGLDLSNAYHRHILDWARGLMRRARPDDGLLRAAKAVLAVDVLMRNAQNGMPAHVFNGVLEVLQEEAIPNLRAEVARVEGKP